MNTQLAELTEKAYRAFMDGNDFSMRVRRDEKVHTIWILGVFSAINAPFFSCEVIKDSTKQTVLKFDKESVVEVFTQLELESWIKL